MLSLAETFSNKLVTLCEVHGEVSAPYRAPYIAINPFGPTWTRQNNFLFTHKIPGKNATYKNSIRFSIMMQRRQLA